MSSQQQHGQPPKRLTVDEFLVWAETQEGRWELYGGVPYLRAPERIGHGEVKFAVQSALSAAIRTAGLGHKLINGIPRTCEQ